MKNMEMATLAIIALSFIMSAYFYSQMPEQMASHWNHAGEVDGYMPKFWALFLMPFVSVGLFLLFVLIPKIDPLKENIRKFQDYYEMFILMLILFLFYLHILTISWNLGFRFDMTQVLIPAFAILFFYVGVLTENAKRNWFIGIRTPWTLSDEKVWEKTHVLGGKLFKIAAVIALMGLAFPEHAIIFMTAPVLLASFYMVIYSYFEYQKRK